MLSFLHKLTGRTTDDKRCGPVRAVSNHFVKQYFVDQGGPEFTVTPHVEQDGRDISRQCGFTAPMNLRTEALYTAIRRLWAQSPQKLQSLTIMPLCVTITLEQNLHREEQGAYEDEETKLLRLLVDHLAGKVQVE